MNIFEIGLDEITLPNCKEISTNSKIKKV